MNRTEYKNQYNKENYDRINLSIPKGMKQVIRELAAEKGLSLSQYFLELVRRDQEEFYDSMQLAEKYRGQILLIRGNTHDGYDVYLKDGRNFHCRTKLEVRKLFSQCLAQDRQSLAQDTLPPCY